MATTQRPLKRKRSFLLARWTTSGVNEVKEETFDFEDKTEPMSKVTKIEMDANEDSPTQSVKDVQENDMTALGEDGEASSGAGTFVNMTEDSASNTKEETNSSNGVDILNKFWMRRRLGKYETTPWEKQGLLK